MFFKIVTVKQPSWTFLFQISGICYHSKTFPVHQVLYVPSWMAKFFSWTLEPIFSSSEPTAEARIGMGATVDIQRQQRMELLDRQLMLSQFAQVRRQRQQVRGRVEFTMQKQPVAEARLPPRLSVRQRGYFTPACWQCGYFDVFPGRI